MRVGIANPFAYRPHVAHMVFLAGQLVRLKHEIFYLGCGGQLASCHSKVAKTGVRRRAECLKCQLGNLASYVKSNLSRIDLEIRDSLVGVEEARKLAYSTASSTLQIEDPAQAASAEFSEILDRSAESIQIAFTNARRWIRDKRLECVFVFNGRFDLTRAIVEACIAESVRYVSVERSWFGRGLQLLPNETCIGLRHYHELCAKWADHPLTYAQAAQASSLVSKRLSRQSVGEWKQYNLGTVESGAAQPIKYLFLPSSQHEWLGHQDRTAAWRHPTEGLQYLFDRLGLKMGELTVRGHPGWSMKIKLYGPNQANGLYRDWCRRVGARYIDASESTDTHDLMRRSPLILVNGSSASMEAAWLGKPLISFVPAAFTTSGISRNLFGPGDVDGLDADARDSIRRPWDASVDPEAQCRAALRYIYCVNFRLMQFVDTIDSMSPYAFRVSQPQDLSGLQALVATGSLTESDRTAAGDDAGEMSVIRAILAGNSASLHAEPANTAPLKFDRIRRRVPYRIIDVFSE